MLADKYLGSKQELTDFANDFRAKLIVNWYVRTTFECSHENEHRKQAVLLIRNESVMQRVIICKRCMNLERLRQEEIELEKEGGKDGIS